jgi:arylsulfatase A-like enzyme
METGMRFRFMILSVLRIANMNSLKWLSVALALLAAPPAGAAGGGESARAPNIIVIVADDLGWSDVGFNGCKEIPTPQLDAIARSGVVLTAGYASHPYCSPSRAGLLTGRYQQRFGHEANPIRETDGLPLDETLLPELLRAAGYRTAAIGKWHLGDNPKFWPTARGFDEWYGFSGGGHDYWGRTNPRRPLSGVLRDGRPVPPEEQTHLTDDFSREAAAFVERNRDRPFFLYLAYNAPHVPDQATREHLQKTAHIEDGQRAVYGAMVAAMDDGIGQVLKKLDELKLRDDTLIFFLSDNGGRHDGAVNLPFRGHKGMVFEGGIRVPFCVAWPARIRAGQTIATPIAALDIFPTALAAAGVAPPEKLWLDGDDLLAHLADPDALLAPRTLVWRAATGEGEYEYAVRNGRYKLVSSVYKRRKLLFDIERDPYEHHDLAAAEPEVVAELTLRYEAWARDKRAPLWSDPHGENVRKQAAARQEIVDKASQR